MVQIENPMCSERTEKRRLRRAIFSPFAFQNASFSGSHSSIQWLPFFEGAFEEAEEAFGSVGGAGAVPGAVIDASTCSGLGVFRGDER
jgi:hypothetical protein